MLNLFKVWKCKRRGTHDYSFVDSKWEGPKKYRVKVHTRVCSACGSIKKIVV